VYWTELNKIRHFEVVLISGAQLKSWTGRAAWSAGGQLPPRLFEQVRDQSGCQAVLFCQLNNYRAYPPLAVGWSLRLVEVERGAILWAIDELFDAGNPSVVNAARRYYQHQAQDARALYDSHSIVDSPRRFGAYTLSASLATMPGR
jgi:hypothetical protein